MSLPLLYCDNRSPCTRSILMLIQALKISVDYKFVDLFKLEQRNEEFSKVNPFQTVPCLKHDDVFLMDSHVILIYLSDMFGDETYFAIKETKKRAIIIDRLFFHATRQFERGRVIMAKKEKQEKR